MTSPFDYRGQVGALGRELDSAIAGSEWSSFLAKRKELLDLMMTTAMPHPPEVAPVGPDGQPAASMIPIRPGSQMQKGTSDQIGQAHFWGIANPESMTAAELQHQIEQRRAEVPRDKQTSLTSALFAGGAAAAAAAGGASELIGRAFENLGAGAEHVPFIGSALASMLSNEQSKLFWQHLQSRAAEAVEAAGAMQPESDRTAFQFVTGVGKMAGYALPAVAAWEGLGAIAGMSRLAWLGRAGTPLARAAAKGALTSAILEDPDAPVESKVMNLGLGAIMGGASQWGRVGASIMLGTVGAGVGSQVGDTPEDRKRHMLEFGVGAAALPMLAPVLAQVFGKVKRAFPDGSVPADQSGGQRPGTVDADYEILGRDVLGPADRPQISGNPVPAEHRALGAPGQSMPTDAEGLSALLHSEPPKQLGAGGALVVAEPVQDAAGLRSLIQGGPRALLETPGAGVGSEGILRDADHFQRLLGDPEYRDSMHYPSLDVPVAGTALHNLSDGLAPEATVRDYVQHQLTRTLGAADAQRYNDRESLAAASRGFASVTNGPAHLVGSKVADVNGKPLRVYHGTSASFEGFDPAALDQDALFGPGIYHTESPEIASGYAGGGANPAVVDSYNEQLAINEQMMTQNADRPEQLAALQQQRETIQGMLADAHKETPNVRPALLDIKNPFDIDHQYTPADRDSITFALERLLPDYNWNLVRDENANLEANNNKLSGEEFYHNLSQAKRTVLAQGPSQSLGDWLDVPVDPFLGKSGLNYALQRIGYDGITHIGGARTGNPPHRVWIAFDPAQVHPPFASTNLDAPAAQSSAEAITKQATIMESGTLPIAAGKVEITESDVIDAVKYTMPGGTAVIRGVGKPLDVMREHPDVHFVEREGKLDALVGEFTNEMVDDYKRWGIYEGNIVVTASGIEAEVSYITGKGMVQLKRTAGGPPLRVKIENILPSRYGDPVYAGADLWTSFKADLLHYMNTESAKAGMSPVESLWDPRVPSQIQPHLEDYLNRRGINDPGSRHAIDLAINQSFVEEARDLDPESKEMQARLGDQATIEANDRETGDEPIPVSLEERAESRGFVWLSRAEHDGGILRDLINPEGAFETSMQTDEAAEEFLRSIDRTAPDLTPASDVPYDVTESVPTGAGFEPATGHEETIDTLGEDVRAAERRLDMIESLLSEPLPPQSEIALEMAARLYREPLPGGGHTPPPPPSPGLGGRVGMSPEALPPGQQETLGGQFQRLYRTQPEKWAELERRWSGNHFRYTRYLMASLERDLMRSGVDLGRAWRDVTDLETARAKSDNEAFDWLKEGGEILRAFPAKLLRSGFVTRTHEITSDPERFRRWWGLQKEGYSDPQIKKMIAADEQLRDIYHRLFMSGVDSPSIGFRPEQEILRYISHVRSRQAQGPLASDPYDSRGLLSPVMQFFAEFAREGNVQFRVMDTRTLFNYYVRSMMFKKYQAGAYEKLVSAWQDPRIPKNISSLLLDHASAMRFGYRPEPTMAVKAVQGVVEGMLGVPITTSEAARITGGPLGWMYRSLLGGKTSIFFRDATQPLMALAKVKAGFMARTYRDVLAYWKGGEGKEQLLADYATALKHGWVTRDRPSMEAASAFEAEPGSDTQLLGLTPAQVAARERVARIGDVVFPHWLQRFENLTNTLRLYGKEQQLNQFIPGLAAYRQATAALKEYRQLETQAALEGNLSIAMDYQTFARKSFFSSFQPAIRSRLKELVESGDDEEAAAMFARETVKWSQQVYTVREKPAALRGGFGRLASFLGNFTGQFIEGSVAAMRHGEPEHIARALMVIGGFSYAMKKMGDKLGLRNLSNWAWSSSLRYAGSPLLELGAQATLGYGGAMAAAEDRSMSPLQAEAIKQTPGLVETGLEFFPYTGYARSAGAISEAAQGTTPVRDVARFLVTGDRGSGINFLLDQRARADQFKARYDPATGRLLPNPMRALDTRGGTMPDSVPTTSPIPFAPPTADYRANAYNVTDVEAALRGDVNVLKIFAPEDVQILRSLRGIGTEQAVNTFRRAMAEKLDSASRHPGSGGRQ